MSAEHERSTPDAVPSATAAGRGAGATTGAAAERWTAVAFALSALASAGLGVVYWQGGQPQLEGALLGVALGGIGVGIVVWAKRFMPNEEVAEERKPLASSEEEIAAFTADFEAGEDVLRRRRLLLGMGGAALAAFTGALLFPIRSLGPRPGKDLKVTGYAGGGRRVVDTAGEPVRPSDISEGGVVTVWPEGHVGAADSPTLLIRPLAEHRFRLPARRQDWVVDGVVAYSKLCTHTGCPVGLYQAGEALLLCPCHQSTFDVLDGARPVFGPATRALPQLPLELDDEGFLVASGDFAAPVGPGFWDRGR